MNIKYFRSGNNRIFAVFERLVHGMPGLTDKYYEGYGTAENCRLVGALIIKNSFLESCVEVSETEAGSIDPAVFYCIYKSKTDGGYITRILARDVMVGMVIYEEEMGEGFHEVTEAFYANGIMFIATSLGLAEFKPSETLMRIVPANLIA